MNIRTKIITTIIAMACSLSVSATGIVAILMNFNIQVANTTSIELSDVQGDLYGERYGADNQDLVMQHLFKNGSGVQEAEMNYFCKDVSFSPGSKEITYIFKFILAENAETGVMVMLNMAGVSNSLCYTDQYKVAYGQAEPDWETADDIKVDAKYIVDNQNPYFWLKASLKVNEDAYSRMDTDGTWSFSFTFEGVKVNN